MASILSETFETSGVPEFDNTWTDGSAGGAVDGNATHPASLSGGGSLCCEFDNPTSFDKAAISWTPAGTDNTVYTRAYVYFSALALPDAKSVELIQLSNGGQFNTIYLINNAGTYEIYASTYIGNPTFSHTISTSSTVTTGTWYLVEYGFTLGTGWEFRVGETTIDSATENVIVPLGASGAFTLGNLYTNTGSGTFTAYIDEVELDDADWVGPLDAGGTIIPQAANYYRMMSN